MSRTIEKILEILQTQSENAVDLLDIMTSSRPVSYRKARRSFLYGVPEFKTDWADWYRKRHAFHSLLNKLKREGLIIKAEKKRGSLWRITTSGLRKLKGLKKKKTSVLPARMYRANASSGPVIIAFDIPERERRKRNWLRVALFSLNFRKLQQSVWIGTTGIPAELMSDLKTQDMLPYVHIFSVSKKGTIEEYKQLFDDRQKVV